MNKYALPLLISILLCPKPLPVRADKTADFFTAVKSNQLNTVKAMIADDPTLVTKTVTEQVFWQPVSGWTALHHIAQHPSAEEVPMALLLLSKGARADVADSQGKTPLHLAAGAGGDSDVGNFLVQLFYYAGASTYQADNEGKVPLDYAVNSRMEQRIEFLAHKTGDADRRRPDGMTPLRSLIFSEDTPNSKRIIDILLQNGARSDIFLWVAEGDTDKVKAALKADPAQANLTAGRMGVVDVAIIHNDLPMVRLLLAAGAVLEKKKLSGPLNRAVQLDHLDMARFLLEHGADPNSRDPMHYEARPLMFARGAAMKQLLIRFGAKKSSEPD